MSRMGILQIVLIMGFAHGASAQDFHPVGSRRVDGPKYFAVPQHHSGRPHEWNPPEWMSPGLADLMVRRISTERVSELNELADQLLRLTPSEQVSEILRLGDMSKTESGFTALELTYLELVVNNQLPGVVRGAQEGVVFLKRSPDAE